MRIYKVTANNRKRAFEVRVRTRVYDFPYRLAEAPPTPADPVKRIRIDTELGREAFTYVLRSGREGCVHIDHVLEHNRDPRYMRDLLLHQLTCEALDRMTGARMSKREIMRRLGTSASQLYRLLDPANYRKSIDQMVALLGVLGGDVKLSVVTRRKRVTGRRARAS